MLVLDSGEQWEPEDFQLDVVRDILDGVQTVWMVVPEGAGKTTLMGGVALYHADYRPAANVLLAAASREQCEGLLMQAASFVYNTPGLDAKTSAKGRFRVFEGYRRIRAVRTRGTIQVRAADEKTGDGAIPTLSLLDELGNQKDLKLYRTWRGKLQKRGGQLGVISTASEPGHEFEEAREYMRRHAVERFEDGPYLRAAGPGWVLHDYSLPPEDDPSDLEAVARVNPLSLVTAEVLAAKGPGTPGFDQGHWLRLVCNRPTTAAGSGIAAHEWDGLAEPDVVPGAGEVWGFLDLGWRIDTTAMGVLVWESPERRVIAGTKVLEPPVDEGDVVDGLLDLQEQYGMRRVAYDESAGAQQMAQLLEKGTHPLQVARGAAPIEFVAVSQDNAPMALAAVQLMEAVRNKWLVHDGNPILRRHVLNATIRSTGGEKWRFDRPSDAKGERRRKYPIDLLTGVLMANSLAAMSPGDGGFSW